MLCVLPMAVARSAVSALADTERHRTTPLPEYHVVKLKSHQITNAAAGIQEAG